MKKKKIVITIFIVLVIAVFGTVYWQSVMQDDRSRVDMPVSERQNDEVEPVLEVVAEELGQIWGIDFIPGTPQLVATENAGGLFVVDTESLEVFEIEGVPEVDSRGQGGLLDVAVSPDYDDDKKIYFTYSASGDGGTATHLGRAELDIEELTLRDEEVLYITEPFQRGTSHYGSRVVVDGDYLFVTIGDRGDKDFDDHVSQDTSNVLGTTLRLTRDGSIPDDNPFVDDENVLDEIYSYGHRNAQGMTLHPETGELWQSEHGERDGDEINIIEAGGNYGWPETHTGCDYITGRDIGDLPWDREDIVDPIYYWECNTGGFPPAGMAFYDAEGFYEWKGDLFVGGLASQYLAHFKLTSGELEEQDPLLKEEGWRVRDVVVGEHDGAIYAAVEGQEISLIRIVPRIIEN